MTAAYIVLSHRQPAEIARLVAALRALSPSAHVFVSHDDRRYPCPQFTDPQVHVAAHGEASDWGSWGLVVATLKSFDWALATVDPDIVVLLSGQDYPVRPLEGLEQQLRESRGWVGGVMPLVRRRSWLPDMDLRRYAYRWASAGWIRGDRLPEPVAGAVTFLRKALFAAVAPVALYDSRLGKIGIRWGRQFTADRPCYKGLQWMAVHRSLLDRMLEQTRPGTDLWKAFRHSLVPDEAFLQTALARMELPQPGPGLSYCDWGWTTRPDSPKVLHLEDLPAIVAAGTPFCRKVDHESGVDLLDALDVTSHLRARDAVDGTDHP